MLKKRLPGAISSSRRSYIACKSFPRSHITLLMENNEMISKIYQYFPLGIQGELDIKNHDPREFDRAPRHRGGKLNTSSGYFH